MVLVAAGLMSSSAFAAKVGEKAPSFTLTDTLGKTHSLFDFSGKVVVLEWTNHGCPFVKKYYDEGHMQALQKKYSGQGVVWLSICSSAPGKQGNMSPAEWVSLSAEKGVASSATLIDADGAVGRQYGAVTTPHMYVIDGEGILRYNGAIDSVKSTKTSDIASAEPLLANAVEAVLAGSAVANAVNKPYGCSVKY